ncbi:STN and carboxypeptidase regulatory-like domain-containing protein [Pinibacter soli]|uniref:STN and carboxypeptidase regulatory-like domain-containing protein n=1 Tax=Pinibacter soli TaxID=3044211 RepID=A0ABT6RGJ1_9BACT|nr:STN and carboxypeptidase regulatory-like domain-containing protein [Pinibacter soli]MDI3321683.1 STN and carboxypeptidase regulatory-like domain-containing protein [Pinibacter soli]
MQRLTLIILVFTTFLFHKNAGAQSILNKTISVEVTRQRVEDVLEIISNKGDFYFSYNSNIINRDSLVTISAPNKTIKQILDLIFKSGFEFKESGNYIIIRRTPIKLTLVTNQAVSEDNFFTVTGYIIDEQTGERVRDASIYEKQKLLIATSDDKGYFKLKIKNKYKSIALTVSKENYQDTTVNIQPNYNQQIRIAIVPIDISSRSIIITPQSLYAPDSIYVAVQQPDSSIWLYTYKKLDSSLVETTRLGRLLLSSRLKIQSVNLNKFFTVRPVQVSVLPKVSTNGKLNSQVVNNFSVNILGGYSGGVNGFEMGGLFNIDKKDVKYFQIGGLFNSVGQSVTGVQIGGINNTVMDSVVGMQVGGITNYVKNSFHGVQLGGIYNHIGKSATGLQVGGIANYLRNDLQGMQLGGIYNHVNSGTQGAQIAGITNYSNRYMNGFQLAGIANVTNNLQGVQIAGIVNYAKKMKGLQIGLINIADTSEGVSLGLINIILKGYHKLALYNNEVTDVNIAFKSGTKYLYSILTAGAKLDKNQKAYSAGYGLGTDISFTPRFGINPELTGSLIYLGDFDNANILSRFNLNVHYNITKHFSIFGGPAYSLYYSKQITKNPGYATVIPSEGYSVRSFDNHLTGWIGWNVGIALF